VIAVLTVGAVLILYSAVSGPLDRRSVTSAMAFVTVGFLIGPRALDLLHVSLESATVERVTELALVFLLFGDSARLDLGRLRREFGWPSRLLLIGLPLTMLAGFGAGLLVLPAIGLANAFLLSTMVCSTDAALGQRVVEDPAVPARVRQALDVESGLNDGLAVPFFLVALDISMATLDRAVPAAVAREAASQIGWGVAAGVGVGALAGLIFRYSDKRGWLRGEWLQIFTLAVALTAWALAGALGGSGFIAAFVGGMAFGQVSRQHGPRVSYLTEQAGGLLAAIVWIGFGALAISRVLHDITWQVILYALISLTVVRMLPVALAMFHSGAARPTVAFLGWFGPRGLASVVFALLALERGIPQARTVLTTVTVTVALSVFLHGLTAAPLVAAYHRWYAAAQARRPTALTEATPTHMPRRPRRSHPGNPEEGLAVDAANP
jgi:NhaP-type Na+/H+ or K+/H+ antiporter